MPSTDPPPPEDRRVARPRRPVRAPALPDVVARMVEPLADDTTDPLRRIGLAWGRICGSPLGRHIEPLRVEGATLHVGARSRLWRDAVFDQRATLVSRIRRYVPTVQRIWLHTLPETSPTAPARDAPPSLTPRTEGIDDPELRLAMERLLAARAPTDAG